jgi:hypothetical protein
MPIFHFHITDGRKVHDPRGLEPPDENAARRYAEQLAHGLVPVANVLNTGETFVEVVDQTGSTIARCAVRGNERERPSS